VTPALTFEGQAAIVTGAGSGIGRATALLLAARGAKVLVNDPAPDGRAEAVAREIIDAGGEAIAEGSAIGTPAAARAIVDAALTRFGRIDILVNNAGIARPGAFDAVSDEAIDLVLAVNLAGPYALTRAAWPTFRAQGYGRVVNLSSSAALGSGISGPYAVSKAGVLGLTKEAAIAGRELGVKVNAVMPSAYTPLLLNHPDPAFKDWMRENLPPEAVAAVIAYLASREAEPTGEIFSAGGGLVTRIAFLESRGRFQLDLTPEAVRDHLAEIRDLAGGKPLATQADHEAVYDGLFPGRPGAE
jgi:NAD(P)-dependent dehydrogenase (short-subunit alcohol dehydrogenase family)